MSDFTGIYVRYLSNGDIDFIQVGDHLGYETQYTESEYIAKGILPPINQLPDFETYKKQQP